MRIKTVLAATVFVSSLASLPLASTAYAQKGELYQPSSDWAITKIDAAAQGDGYCALARRFQQNTILTIARNAGEETSIAFDFQRPKMRVGQILEIVLDPGAGQQRSFNITTNSSSALVARLGRDEPFFNALEKTGYLRAEIGNQSYHFNLADIDIGQSDLRACVAAMTQPAAGGGAITPYAPPATKSDYIPMAVSADVRALEGENERLRLALADMKADEYKSGAKYNQKASADIERLQKENERMRKSLELVQSGADATADLRAEIDALKAQNQKLKVLADEAGSQDARALVTTLTEENRRLQDELSKTASSVTPQETQEFVASLEIENAALRETLERERKAYAQKTILPEGELASLQTEIDVLKEQNAQLRGQADLARNEVKSSYEGRLKEQQAINKKLQEAIDNQGIDAQLVDDMRAQLSQIKTENSLLQRTAAQAQAQAIRDKNAEIADLREQLRQAYNDASSVETPNLQAKFDQAIKERDTFEATAQAQREEIAFLKGGGGFGTSADSSILQAKIDALSAENDTLRAEMSIALNNIETAAGAGADIAVLEQENASLRARVDELTYKADGLQVAKAELAQLEAQNAILTEQLTRASTGSADLTRQLEDALADNQILQTQINRQGSDLGELNELAAKIEALEEQNGSLQTQLSEELAAKDKELAEKDGALAQAQRTIEELQSENGKLNERLAMMDTIQSDPALEEKVAILEVENNKLVAALEQALDEASTYRTALAEYETNEFQMADASAEMEGLRAENAVLRERLENDEGPDHRLVRADAPIGTSQARMILASAQAQDVIDEPALLEEKVASVGFSYVPVPDVKPHVIPVAEKTGGLTPGGALQVAQAAELNAIEAAAGEEEPPVEALLDAPAKIEEHVEELAEPAEEEIAEPPEAPHEDELQARIKRELQEQMDEANESAETQVLGPSPEDILAAQEQAPATPAPQPQIKVAPAPAQKPVRVAEPLAQDPVLPVEQTVGLSEAQKQEMLLQQSIEQGGQPVIARRSEDPYEPFKAIEEPQEQAVIAREEISQPVIEPVVEEVIMAAPQEGLKAQDMAAAPSVNEMAEPAIVGAPSSLQQESVKPVTVNGAFHPAFTVDSLLSRASIPVGTVKLVEKASGPEVIVHQWQAENIYGSAEQKPLRSEADFEGYVREYLEKTQSRCTGDFAVVPDDTAQYGETRVDSYEVACVGGGVNSSASLLFFNKGGTFTVVAHEAPTEYMDGAMALRDRLMRAVN